MLLETKRLILREFTIDDASFILELLNTKGWLRFIGDRKVKTILDAQAYIETKLRPSYQIYNFGFWCVLDKETGDAIGMNGLIKRDNLEHVDLGFAFLPEHTKQGFALESSLAIMEYANKQLGLEKVIAITDQDNYSSQSLLEKLNFDRVGLVVVQEEWGESLLYEKVLSTSI